MRGCSSSLALTRCRHCKTPSRGLKNNLHAARKMADGTRGWEGGSWEPGSHPGSGASRVRFRNSCVAVGSPSRRPEVEVEEDARDAVLTASPQARAHDLSSSVGAGLRQGPALWEDPVKNRVGTMDAPVREEAGGDAGAVAVVVAAAEAAAAGSGLACAHMALAHDADDQLLGAEEEQRRELVSVAQMRVRRIAEGNADMGSRRDGEEGQEAAEAAAVGSTVDDDEDVEAILLAVVRRPAMKKGEAVYCRVLDPCLAWCAIYV